MKPFFLGVVLTLLVVGLLPFAFIARSRASQSENLPVHLVMDMDKQTRGKAQRETPLFADWRFMRPEIEHTVALEDMSLPVETLNDTRGTHPIALAGDKEALELQNPSEYATVMLGRIRPTTMTDEDFDKVSGTPPKNEAEIAKDATYYVRRVPAVLAVSEDFMKRGQERFNIYCAPCHGETGYGDGPVANRAAILQKTPDAVNGWVPPQNLQEAKMLARPDGHIFNTITNGIRNMPAYDKQISVMDRWAIVAYIRALERSQNAQPGDIPATAK